MPINEKIELSLTQFKNALERLNEALSVSIENNDLAIDGTIQRFEFCVELCWKTLKRCLAEEGQQTTSPREAIKQAFQNEWINNEEIWLGMLDDRNQTSHTYREELAKKIYQHIPDYYQVLSNLYSFLNERYNT